MSNVIKAHAVVMPGAVQPAAGPGGFPPLRDKERSTARWLLDVAPLWHVLNGRVHGQLAAAREEAAAIVAAAGSEVEAIRTRAREAGHEEGVALGREAGIEQIRAELQELLATVRGVLEEAARVAAAAAERHEEEIVQLALAVAARLSRRPDVLGPETVRQVLQEVLPRAAGTEEITIRLHSEDLEALQALAPGLVDRLNGGARVAWIPDDSITRGGCLIETDRGRLDARVETRFQRLAESLWDVVQGGA